MKKFFTSLFILAVFSGVVFYIGWTQFRVKPEQIGVVISKTDGVNPKPVKNGEFAWNWQFLLPTNAELKCFTITPVNTVKTVKGQLPSGEVYSAIYNTADTFNYEFEFSISLTVYPEAVVELLELNKITSSEDLEQYLKGAADYIAQLAADYYLKKSQENQYFRPESVRRDDLLRSIQVYNEYPEIELSTFALVYSRIPDYALYRRLQGQYLNAQVYSQSNQSAVPENDVAEVEKTSESVPEAVEADSEYSVYEF